MAACKSVENMGRSVGSETYVHEPAGPAAVAA